MKINHIQCSGMTTKHQRCKHTKDKEENFLSVFFCHLHGDIIIPESRYFITSDCTKKVRHWNGQEYFRRFHFGNDSVERREHHDRTIAIYEMYFIMIRKKYLLEALPIPEDCINLIIGFV
jgi:hypothetical protein